MSYTSVSEVRQLTGIRHSDLKLETSEALDVLLEEWIAHVKDMIDREVRRDFADLEKYPDGVPGVVASVALRAMRNYVGLAVASRETPIVRVDEWRVNVSQTDEVLSENLREELRSAFPGADAAMPRGFGMFVAHGGADDE